MASLTGLPDTRCRTLLRELAEAHLVEQFSPDRYRMHDLARLYAMERGPAPGPSRTAAHARLIDHYLHSAHSAVEQLVNAGAGIRLPEPEPGTAVLSFADPNSALDWLGTEHHSMAEAQRIATGHGWVARVWQLPWLMRPLHHLRFHAAEETDMWRHAATVIAADDGDATARAIVHCQLAKALVLHGDPGEALEHIDIALSVPPRDTIMAVLSGAANVLSLVATRLDQTTTILPRITAVVDLLRDFDDPVSLALALNATALMHVNGGGDTDAALAASQEALEQLTKVEYDPMRAAVLDTIGTVHRSNGDHAEALRYFRESLELFDRDPATGNREVQLENLLDTHLALDDLDSARAVAADLLAIYEPDQRDTAAEQVRARLRDHLAART